MELPLAYSIFFEVQMMLDDLGSKKVHVKEVVSLICVSENIEYRGYKVKN